MSPCINCGATEELETVEYEHAGEFEMCSRCLELGHGPADDDGDWGDHDYGSNADYFLNEVL